MTPPKPRKVPSRAPEPLPDCAFITVQLERATGKVTLIDEQSTPGETWVMLATACALASEKVDRANGIISGEEA